MQALRASVCHRETQVSESKPRWHWSILGVDWDKSGLPPGIHNAKFGLFAFLFSPHQSKKLLKIAPSNPRQTGRERGCECQQLAEMTCALPSVISFLGQMCFSAILSDEAGGSGHRERAYACLPLCCRPDMCYFLLAQPTCSAKAL